MTSKEAGGDGCEGNTTFLRTLMTNLTSNSRARKLYTSARIYEWKFGKGEWKLPFASPTGRVDFFGFVIIFEEKKKK